MASVVVSPSQSGPRSFDVFVNGRLYRGSLLYPEALTLAQRLRFQFQALQSSAVLLHRAET